MDEVVSAKSVMQQSLFSADDAVVAPDSAMLALQASEQRFVKSAGVSLGVAGLALVASLVALGIAILR